MANRKSSRCGQLTKQTAAVPGAPSVVSDVLNSTTATAATLVSAMLPLTPPSTAAAHNESNPATFDALSTAKRSSRDALSTNRKAMDDVANKETKREGSKVRKRSSTGSAGLQKLQEDSNEDLLGGTNDSEEDLLLMGTDGGQRRQQETKVGGGGGNSAVAFPGEPNESKRSLKARLREALKKREELRQLIGRLATERDQYFDRSRIAEDELETVKAELETHRHHVGMFREKRKEYFLFKRGVAVALDSVRTRVQDAIDALSNSDDNEKPPEESVSAALKILNQLMQTVKNIDDSCLQFDPTSPVEA